MRTTLMMLLLMPMFSYAQSEENTNRKFSCTTTTTAPPSEIWNIWTDVAEWKAWDTGLKDAMMEGDFKLDAKGQIISLEGRKSKFKVVDFKEGTSYTFKTKLPLGSLYVKRILEVEGSVTRFTHEVWFKGLTGSLFAKAFGPKFRKMLPGVLENIKNIAEQ